MVAMCPSPWSENSEPGPLIRKLSYASGPVSSERIGYGEAGLTPSLEPSAQGTEHWSLLSGPRNRRPRVYRAGSANAYWLFGRNPARSRESERFPEKRATADTTTLYFWAIRAHRVIDGRRRVSDWAVLRRDGGRDEKRDPLVETDRVRGRAYSPRGRS